MQKDKRSGMVKARNGFRDIDMADYLALAPGLLMCLMLLIMLILSIAMPEMAEAQYTITPGLFSVVDSIIVIAGIIQIGIRAKGKELHFRKSDALFAAFAVFIVLSTCVNGLTIMTFNGVPYRFIGIQNTIAFMLIYMGVSRSIKKDALRQLVLLAYLAVADLIGAVALYDVLTGAVDAFHDKKELSAVFFNGNHYGYFLLMSVLIGMAYFLFGRGKIAAFGAGSAILNLVLLGVNHSLGCILALIIVFACTSIIILIRDRTYTKRLAVLAASLMGVFVFLALISPALRAEFTGLVNDVTAIMNNSASGSEGHRRLQMWRLICGFISEKPLLGFGCEGISFMLYEAMQVSDAHSELLSYAAFYGIPAALLYTAGVLGVIGEGVKSASAASVQQKAACMAAAGYFVSSLVGVGMFYTVPFFFLFLGLASND